MENIDSKEDFIKLFQKYQNLVFSICLKLTGDYFAAEDLTQETFLSAYKHLQSFDGENEKAWLCRIASNKCTDYLRAAARRAVPTTEEDMPEPKGPETMQQEPLGKVLNKELLEELAQACSELKSPYQEVAEAHFVRGKPSAEIAKETGIGVDTVKTRIRRAREMLKKSIRKEMLQT